MSSSHSEYNDNVFVRYLCEPLSFWFTEFFLRICEAINDIDSFQWKILHVFCLIIVVNTVLIAIAWSKYGEKIGERFMKPLSKQTLEALKQEARALKLPHEHTPRI